MAGGKSHSSLPEPFLIAVDRLISRCWPGAAVRDVTLLKEWNRSYVARCSVVPLAARDPAASSRGTGSEYGDAPTTVIAKQVKEQRERGFDDWAGVQFLTSIGDGSGGYHAPRFLAGDQTASLFLMEDISPSASLDDVLNSNVASAGRAALLDLARTTGAMQAACAGREAEYGRLRGTLSATPEPARYERASEFERGWDVLRLALEMTDASPARLSQAAREHAQIVGALAEPGALLTYTHGDVAPTNTLLGPEGCRLIDFEYGGYRHAFYDTLFWRVLCPLPESLADAMDAAYREVLRPAFPTLADDHSYAQARAGFAMYGVWRTVIWHLRRALERDGPWAGGMTVRAALVFQLPNAADVAQRDACYPALVETCFRLAEVLAARWTAEASTLAVPQWPAYRAR